MDPVFWYRHSQVSERLQHMLKVLPAETASTYCLLGGADDTELWPPQAEPVVILIAANRQALSQLLSLKGFLRGIRIILGLPDDKEETIALAHRLKPRYLCYLNDNYSELNLVVSKMLGHSL